MSVRLLRIQVFLALVSSNVIAKSFLMSKLVHALIRPSHNSVERERFDRPAAQVVPVTQADLESLLDANATKDSSVSDAAPGCDYIAFETPEVESNGSNGQGAAHSSPTSIAALEYLQNQEPTENPQDSEEDSDDLEEDVGEEEDVSSEDEFEDSDDLVEAIESGETFDTGMPFADGLAQGLAAANIQRTFRKMQSRKMLSEQTADEDQRVRTQFATNFVGDLINQAKRRPPMKETLAALKTNGGDKISTGPGSSSARAPGNSSSRRKQGTSGSRQSTKAKTADVAETVRQQETTAAPEFQDDSSEIPVSIPTPVIPDSQETAQPLTANDSKASTVPAPVEVAPVAPEDVGVEQPTQAQKEHLATEMQRIGRGFLARRNFAAKKAAAQTAKTTDAEKQPKGSNNSEDPKKTNGSKPQNSTPVVGNGKTPSKPPKTTPKPASTPKTTPKTTPKHVSTPKKTPIKPEPKPTQKKHNIV